jgi:hypothetical protein
LKSKIQKSIKYLVCILFVLCLLHTLVGGYATEEPSHGRESTVKSVPYHFMWWVVGYYTLESVADVQGHLVYDDSGNGGYENYAIFLYGRLTSTGSKINVGIYVTAYYEIEWMSMCSGNTYIFYQWGAPPVDFITWDGDMDYGATTPGIWQYTVGTSVQGFSFGYTYTSQASCNAYPQVNPPIVDDIYRHMGYFSSVYNDGGHKFKACVRLMVHNDVATEWASGVTTFNPGVAILTWRILSIRVKVVFKYYDTTPTIWDPNPQGTNSHLLGDGVNPDNNDADISQIPFVVGSC